MYELNIKCEYLQKARGVQNPNPRFSWALPSSAKAQRSYEIIVKEGDREVWNSECIEDWRSFGIEYSGQPLRSECVYDVHVRVELIDGSVHEGETTFETGRFSETDWQGVWITKPGHIRGVSILLRNEFHVDVPVRKARLYISGIGYNLCWINGISVSENQMDPGWTDYRKTILYNVFDITEYLSLGDNVLGVELGEGWLGNEHEGFKKLVGGIEIPWLNVPMLRSDLVIEYDDGRTLTVSSDGENWRCADGAITYNNIYDGEVYDARQIKDGWQMPGYDLDADWIPAVETQSPGGKMVSQIMPPIKCTRKLRPIHINYGRGENYIFDLGENFSGKVEICAEGEAGQKITLRHAEILDAGGELNINTLRGAANTDTYIFRGRGKETYSPTFTYHGFRYVEVSMDPGVKFYDLTGIKVNTDVRQTGSFSCSSSQLNKIQEVMLRTELNNLHSLPTDCPQRDERFGWLNDMTVRCEEAMYNFDMALLYEKWMHDIEDGQDPETGSIQDAAPGYFTGPAAGHPSSVYVLIPWFLYSFYGDTQCFRRHYDSIKRYIDFKLSQRTENGLMDSHFFGEWAQPMTECVLGYGEGALSKTISQTVGTTGYLYYDLVVMARMAKVIGKMEDADWFQAQSEAVKEAFVRNLIHDDGICDSGNQGAQAFALFLGLMPENMLDSALAKMIKDIVDRNFHTSTGNQMTKYLFETLNAFHRNDVSLKLLNQTTYPSIGYMLANGATSLWERWEKMEYRHMNSHNHPMLGAFTVWFYKALGGLDARRGFNERCVLATPDFIEGIDRAEVQVETPRGLVKIQWERQNGHLIEVNVSVPWNTELFLKVPDGYSVDGNDQIELLSGTYTLSVKPK